MTLLDPCLLHGSRWLRIAQMATRTNHIFWYGEPVSVCIASVPELGNLAFGIKMPNVDSVLIVDIFSRHLVSPLNIHQHDNYVFVFKKRFGLKEGKVHIVQGFKESIRDGFTTMAYLIPRNIGFVNAIFPFDIIGQLGGKTGNVLPTKGIINLLYGINVATTSAHCAVDGVTEEPSNVGTCLWLSKTLR